MDPVLQEENVLYFYNRNVLVDSITVSLEFVTPSLNFAYQRNQIGDVTQLTIDEPERRT